MRPSTTSPRNSRSAFRNASRFDGSGAGYFALYLTPELSNNAMVMISDVWGHFHSRIVDKQELVSYWDAVDPQNHELPIY